MGMLSWSGKQIASGYGKGRGVLGRTGMGAATGAFGGGIYGATLGRDPGQSRFGGALTGALGGAALGAGMGRYGASTWRGARGGATLGGSGYRQSSLFAGPMQRSALGSWGGAARGAGRALWKNVSYDAGGSSGFIGRGINKGINSFKTLKKNWGASGSSNGDPYGFGFGL